MRYFDFCSGWIIAVNDLPHFQDFVRIFQHESLNDAELVLDLFHMYDHEHLVVLSETLSKTNSCFH